VPCATLTMGVRAIVGRSPEVSVPRRPAAVQILASSEMTHRNNNNNEEEKRTSV